jgi:hypothetical protein
MQKKFFFQWLLDSGDDCSTGSASVMAYDKADAEVQARKFLTGVFGSAIDNVALIVLDKKV